MKCVFIGERFYHESSTMMSSVYILSNNKFSRTSWGDISQALTAGKKVEIRPAHKKEIAFFEKQLESLLKQKIYLD